MSEKFDDYKIQEGCTVQPQTKEELVDIILELAAGKKNVDDILQWIILHQKE